MLGNKAETNKRLQYSVKSSYPFKEDKLLAAIKIDNGIVSDFNYVESAPHSLLSALLASPIKSLGMKAY